MISPQLTPTIRRWLEAGGRRSRGFRLHVNTTSVTMVKAMVRQGDAVSLIHPDEVRVELARGEFVPLDFGAPPLTFHTGLVWLTDRSLSPAGVAFAREMFAEVGVDAESSLCRSAVGGKSESHRPTDRLAERPCLRRLHWHRVMAHRWNGPAQ
jgi:DNA-binding transcriptional LysR family regulator